MKGMNIDLMEIISLPFSQLGDFMLKSRSLKRAKKETNLQNKTTGKDIDLLPEDSVNQIPQQLVLYLFF